MKRDTLATQHRILNVLIVLALIAAVYLVIKNNNLKEQPQGLLFLLKITFTLDKAQIC